MAKFEKTLYEDFDSVLNRIHQGILKGSISASYEDGSDYEVNGIYVSVRVYERYSYFGKNRVSLNVTLVGDNNCVHVTAITSGGSQAVFVKLNTFGETNFLATLEEILR